MASGGLTGFVREMRRRQLFGVLALYVVGAWVALQVADILFPGWNVPEEAIRFVWIGAVLLFPIAIVFGWIYDVSAQGIRRTPPVTSDADALPLGKSDYGILSLLALASLAIGIGVVLEVAALREAPVTRSERAPSEIPENSIAVLPFVNMSDDASNEYFSDGISEQLLNELARVPDLHVAARTSSFYYKNRDEPMQIIGRELGVRTLLEGSVRKSGNSVRITAQLINAEDGYHLWSHSYDRDLDDIFVVQDEIARAITRTLKVELMLKAQQRLERPATVNADAYDLYLRALATKGTLAENATADSSALLQQAIDIAPDFALAYQELAYNYLLETFEGTRSIDDAVAEGEPLLAKALELRPDLEEAYATLGLMYDRLGHFDDANEYYQTALAINPNYVSGHVGYGLALVHQSRLKEASAAYLRAQVLDPMNGGLSFNLGAMLMLMGEFDSGIEFIDRAISINSDHRIAKGAKTHWYAVYGKLAEAVMYGRHVYTEHPEFAPNIRALISAYVDIGMLEEATELIDLTSERLPDLGNIEPVSLDIWLAEGNLEAFNNYADEQFRGVDVNLGMPLNYRDKYRAFLYGWSLLNRGDNEQAVEVLFWAAGGEDGIEATTYDYMQYLKMLAISYLRTEREDEAHALLNRCLELVRGANERGWATPTLYVRLAELHVLRDDIDSAIENLDIAFDKGWRGLSTIEHGVYWQILQDNADLERIKVRILEDLELQRRRLQAMSADGVSS